MQVVCGFWFIILRTGGHTLLSEPEMELNEWYNCLIGWKRALDTLIL